MKNLKHYAAFLKNKKLEAFTKQSMKVMKTMDIPLMKLFAHIPQNELIRSALTSNEKFFASLIDGTAKLKARENLRLWEADKLPGVPRNAIQPSDLVLIYALQKKMMLRFLIYYTDKAGEVIRIMSELEDYYAVVQEEAVKTLFKIQLETENQLKESEERYRDLFENTNDLIYLLGQDGKICFVNSSWLREMGYKKEEVIGSELFRYIHPDSLSVLENASRQAGQKETQASAELRFLTKKGELLDLEANISCQFRQGKPILTRGILRNITRRKIMEIELKNKALELTRSNSELEQFAYVASHDLQEPLRMINSYIQLLSDRYKDKLDADASDFIRFAVDGSNRMRTLIQSLLEYSRVNRIKPFEWVSTDEVLASVKNDLEKSILEKGAIISSTPLPMIYADPVLIGQLFQNLISNALKFTGNNKPVITISGKKEKGYCLFSVKDNGIGIQKEYFNKIFVIFQRLNSMEKYPGTGIGLAICKKIAERHGGEIRVESKPGKGSVFYFTIKQTEEQPHVNGSEKKRDKDVLNSQPAS